MRFHMRGWALLIAIALVVTFASTALAIEAFQERFEWGDLSKPTTIQGRVIVVDPYDKAVWISAAVFGGNAESGLWWQRLHPGKTVKFYAKDDAVWKKLKGLGRTGEGPTAAKSIPASSKASMVEIVATEPQQNYRVIHSVKSIRDVAGKPGATVSIGALHADSSCADETAEKCMRAKTKLAGAPKAVPRQRYDVMLPGGQPVGGMIPWTMPYNLGE